MSISEEVEVEYLSIQDAARMLDVAPVTVRRRIEAGELPATQLGGAGSSIRIPRAALEAWLWSGPSERN
jgi:excisionase family DNA binding protein